MKTTYSLKWMLAAGMMVAACGQVATAQNAGQGSVKDCKGSYLVRLTALTINTPEELAASKHSVLASAVYWDNLYNVGKVSVLGAAQNGGATFSVVILQGVSETEARSIADGVPSVKAGVTSAEVLPIQVLQASSQMRKKPGR